MKERISLQSFMDLLAKVGSWLTAAASFCLAIAMILGVIDMIGAKVFNWPLLGMIEATEELMVGMVFLTIGYVAMKQEHIRITILEPYMPKLVRIVLEVVGYVLGILVAGVISWRAFVLLQLAIHEHIHKPTQPLLPFPIWPGVLAVFLGSCFLLIAFILHLGKTLRA